MWNLLKIKTFKKLSGMKRTEDFSKKGTDDPKFRLIKFHTIEATFWIEGKFRTCKYKQTI